MMGTVFRFIRRHLALIMILVALVLIWRVWAGERERERLQGTIEGFELLGPDSSVAATTPIVIREPMALERFFKTDVYKRWEQEFSEKLDELERIKIEIENAREKPGEITILEAESSGDSLRFGFGETVDHPALMLDIPEPETYRLRIHPRRYRVGIVETEEGTSYAEIEDLTLGETLRVTDFTVRRRAPGWRWRWLRWDVGLGISGDENASGFNYQVGMNLLEAQKGRFGLGVRVEIDRHRAFLGLRYRRP